MSSHKLEGLKFIREELGVSAVELAKLIGKEPATYYRYENGTRRPYWDQVDTIAVFLGVPHEMLKHIPTGQALVELVDLARNRKVARIESDVPAERTLLPRPLMTEGGGLTAVKRPLNDDELRQLDKDPADYEPLPLDEHQPEIQAMAAAGAAMGDASNEPDLEELRREWSD